MSNIDIDILTQSYHEHLKRAKELVIISPNGSKQIDEINKALKEISEKLKSIS